MSEFWSFFFELLKLTIPALVVFATAYYLIKRQLDANFRLKQLEIKQSSAQATIPLKMQAYERLAMFCERSSTSALLSRFYEDDKTSGEILFLMVGAVKQEYEHNVSQQVYVSENLWKIVKIARNQSIAALETIGEKVGLNAKAIDLYSAIQEHLNERESDPLSLAQSAIRQEAALYL